MSNLEIIKSKILSGSNIERSLSYWRFRNSSIVFTNGCFDIIHRGHVDYLARAAELGDVLIVGLNTDRSVRAIKGPPRPLQDEISRSFLLASLYFVSGVILFDEDTPVELLSRVKPNILVKGSDYKPEEVVGGDLVIANGGKVMNLPVVEGYSTSSIVKKSRS